LEDAWISDVSYLGFVWIRLFEFMTVYSFIYRHKLK